MTVNAAHVSIAINGDIRWTGPETGTYYTWLELHRFLGSLADDGEASGDDLVDITSSTPSVRSTDQIFTANAPYNVDDTLARFFYDGSWVQNGGDDRWSGLEIIGPVETGTEPIIIQDNKALPAYWGTGINPVTGTSTFMRISVKTREGGADIDGSRIKVLARELGDQNREFPVTLGLANSVAAIGNGSDLNNTSSDATIEGWTSIVNTEGWQELDIDGTGATGQEFYSQWDKGSQTLNETYERTKWIQQRSATVDTNTETGNDFVVDDNDTTALGRATEFSAGLQNEILTAMKVRLKIGAGTPTGPIYLELYDSDDVATAAPTGAVLANSEQLSISLITSNYQDVLFRFHDNVTLTANQEYFVVVRHPTGTSANYLHVEGDTTSSDDGNVAVETPASTWTGTASQALNFEVYTSPIIHSIAGEMFRGIDYGPIAHDGASGNFTEDEVLFWGTQVTYDTLVSTFVVGEYVSFDNAGTVVNGGKVLKDSGTVLWVALEDISGGTLADGYGITGVDSGATADINTTIVDQDKGGGEGLLLAFDDDGTTGNFYIQLLTGVAPVDNLQIEGRTSGQTCLVNVTITSRTISPEFVGQSTGTNLIGAYGIGFDITDVGASDKFFDLANTQRVPPNNQTFTVAGLVASEDRVLVGPRTGAALETGQFSLTTTLSGAAETAVVVGDGVEDGTPLAIDIPQDGNTTNTRLRIALDTGVFHRQAYTSWTTSTFTIPSSDYSGGGIATSGNDVWIAFIDVLADAITEAYTATFDAARDLFVRVRDGGGTPIVTFEATGAQFLGLPQTVTAIRNSDA